jgi:hypothetical protein
MRNLFVGVTRATIKLTMILSARSARMLIDRLSDNDAIV